MINKFSMPGDIKLHSLRTGWTAMKCNIHAGSHL